MNCGQQVAAKLSLKVGCDLSHWHEEENCYGESTHYLKRIPKHWILFEA